MHRLGWIVAEPEGTGHRTIRSCCLKNLSETGTEQRFLSWLYNKKKNREVTVTRKQEYRQLAENVCHRAAEEENAQFAAQWRILGARYLELADQAKEPEEKD